MPGNRRPVLGADDEHVAAVAIGDDLLLQVLRRVLAAQVRFERAAQPRALLAQPIAKALQLRARIVHAPRPTGSILRRTSRDLALERRRGSTMPRRRGTPRAGRRIAGARSRRPRRGTWRAPADAAASSARPSTAERFQDRFEIAPGAQRDLAVPARKRAVSAGCRQCEATPPAASVQRMQARRVDGVPGGVCA